MLSFFSSLATLTSHLMDFTLVYMSPPGLLSLVATQVSSVGQKLTQKLILPFFFEKVVIVVKPSTALVQLAKFVLTVILGELIIIKRSNRRDL